MNFSPSCGIIDFLIINPAGFGTYLNVQCLD